MRYAAIFIEGEKVMGDEYISSDYRRTITGIETVEAKDVAALIMRAPDISDCYVICAYRWNPARHRMELIEVDDQGRMMRCLDYWPGRRRS